jgi:hypothetical protein
VENRINDNFLDIGEQGKHRLSRSSKREAMLLNTSSHIFREHGARGPFAETDFCPSGTEEDLSNSENVSENNSDSDSPESRPLFALPVPFKLETAEL